LNIMDSQGQRHMTQVTCGLGIRNPAAGFSLIELMVTILIASILVAIAVPSYTAQTRKSRRTEARNALLELASREERFNSTNSVYTSNPENLGYSGAWPVRVGSGYYQVTACANAPGACPTDAGTGAAFLLTAQPVPDSSQAGDAQCGSFILDNTGAEAVSGTGTASSCWN
jgi:type IV pilus assembly protein PilE